MNSFTAIFRTAPLWKTCKGQESYSYVKVFIYNSDIHIQIFTHLKFFHETYMGYFITQHHSPHNLKIPVLFGKKMFAIKNFKGLYISGNVCQHQHTLITTVNLCIFNVFFLSFLFILCLLLSPLNIPHCLQTEQQYLIFTFTHFP